MSRPSSSSTTTTTSQTREIATETARTRTSSRLSTLSEPLLQNNQNETNDDNDDDVVTTGAIEEENEEISSSSSSWIVDGLPWDLSILIKSLYFLDALGASTWGRFGAIYYNQHGLNSQHVGIIEGLNTAIPTISMTIWGILADRLHARKKIWLVTKTGSTIMLLLLALPIVYNSFINILIVSIVSKLFVSGGILDSYTLECLGTENKIFYGRYRLYASLSWGIGSMVMGYITDNYGFEPNFIMFGLLGFCMIVLVGARIPETKPPEQPSATTLNVGQNDDNVPEMGQISELLYLAIRPRVLIFLVEVVIMGAAMATVERLLFLYLVNDLEASTVLCGLSVGVNVLFELPIFWYASEFMAVLGHDGMFLLSMTCFSIRVIGYTLLTPATKWFVLLLEVMHGVTFACFWVVSTDISKVLVHQTQGAFWGTAIPSAVQTLYSAVGVSLGSVIGGWAMHKYGSREMYTATAGIVFCTLIVQLFGSVITRILSPGSSFLPDYPHEHEGQQGGESNNSNRDSGSGNGTETIEHEYAALSADENGETA